MLGHTEFQFNWSVVYGLAEELERLPAVTAAYTIGDESASWLGEVSITAPQGTKLKLVVTDVRAELRGFAGRKRVCVRFHLADSDWIQQVLDIVRTAEGL